MSSNQATCSWSVRSRSPPHLTMQPQPPPSRSTQLLPSRTGRAGHRLATPVQLPRRPVSRNGMRCRPDRRFREPDRWPRTGHPLRRIPSLRSIPVLRPGMLPQPRRRRLVHRTGRHQSVPRRRLAVMISGANLPKVTLWTGRAVASAPRRRHRLLPSRPEHSALQALRPLHWRTDPSLPKAPRRQHSLPPALPLLPNRQPRSALQNLRMEQHRLPCFPRQELNPNASKPARKRC